MSSMSIMSIMSKMSKTHLYMERKEYSLDDVKDNKYYKLLKDFLNVNTI